MRLSFAQDRVLAVMAHPDDAELLCAGTLARAKADGAAIGICVMCRGDKGVAAGQKIENLGEVRRGEAGAAAGMLGAELFWFASPDGELMDGVAERMKLVEIYRRFRPTLVIAHCGEDYHSDHRGASALTEAASWACASHGLMTDSPAMDAPPALWWADAINMSGFVPEFYVDVSDYVELKKKMLAAHRSQLARGQDADFAPLAELMLRQCQARGAEAGVNAAEAFGAHRALKRLRAW